MAPLIRAHRGDSAHAPENTMAAFRMALAAGAQGLELDVHATADGHLVVVHDFDLTRTTGRRSFVHDTTLEEIRALDAGSWRSSSYAGERIPLLRDVLDLGGVDLELELKGLSRPFVDRVLGAVVDAGALDRVEFTSPHPLLLSVLRGVAPSARIGLFARPRPPWMADGLHRRLVLADSELLGADVVHVPSAMFTPEWVEACHAGGVAAHAADAEDAATIRRVAADGADQLSTSDPALAVATLGPAGPG